MTTLVYNDELMLEFPHCQSTALIGKGRAGRTRDTRNGYGVVKLSIAGMARS
ncbi:MAG: hypothetical protein ACXWTY_00350 [Methylobacter sp.]